MDGRRVSGFEGFRVEGFRDLDLELQGLRIWELGRWRLEAGRVYDARSERLKLM